MTLGRKTALNYYTIYGTSMALTSGVKGVSFFTSSVLKSCLAKPFSVISVSAGVNGMNTSGRGSGSSRRRREQMPMPLPPIKNWHYNRLSLRTNVVQKQLAILIYEQG